eukprot:1546940-Amphidinium_carterae.1
MLICRSWRVLFSLAKVVYMLLSALLTVWSGAPVAGPAGCLLSAPASSLRALLLIRLTIGWDADASPGVE